MHFTQPLLYDFAAELSGVYQYCYREYFKWTEFSSASQWRLWHFF